MSTPAPLSASTSHLAASLAHGKEDRRRLLSILNEGARKLVPRVRTLADEKNARGNIATKTYINTRRDQYEAYHMHVAKELDAACRALAKAQQWEAERRVAVQDIEQAMATLEGNKEEQRKYMNEKVALMKKHAEELAALKATKGGKQFADASGGGELTCTRRSRYADDEAEVDHDIDASEALADAAFAALMAAHTPAKKWPKNAGEKHKICSVVSDGDEDVVQPPKANRQRTGDQLDVKHNMTDVTYPLPTHLPPAARVSSASTATASSAMSVSSSAPVMSATASTGSGGVSPVAEQMQLLSILSRS